MSTRTSTRIDELTDDIAENRVPGGSAFARAAAELIMLRVQGLDDAASPDTVRETVVAAAEWAARTKPSMAVVRNVADLAVSVLGDAGSDAGSDAASLRRAVADAMTGFIARSSGAVTAIGELADEVFVDGATVLVHSYSASLEAMLRTAVARGRTFTLLVTESRPYRESRRLIDAVADSGVDIVLYSDAAMAVAATAADVALVGADSVYTDGSFANKTGSLPLALVCREHGVPLYVATELAKVYFGDAEDVEMELRPAAELSEGWPLIESGRVRVWNQFFERVEAGYVTAYLTEVGVLAPDAIRAAASESWQSPAAGRELTGSV